MKSKNICELKVGDVVIGPTGPVKVTNIIPEYIPTRMFSIKFSVGTVKCSGDHLWFVYLDNEPNTLTTLEVFSLYTNHKTMNFGEKSGPTIKSMKEIKPEPVCCIDIDSDDKLFKLDLENGEVYTHNCQFRAACGRLGSIASMMLFGNTMATTIDGSHPGAGMISANGAISSIQYYYEGIEWIQGFYKKCGYDSTGHRVLNGGKPQAKPITPKDMPEEEKENDNSDIEDFTMDLGIEDNDSPETENHGEAQSEEEEYLQDLDNIFDFKRDVEKIEMQGISGEVDKTKRQKFE